MEQLKHMKKKLIECAYEEINHNLEALDTKELGEVIDMIKDLEMAIYYHTVAHSMNEYEEKMEHKEYKEHKPEM